MMNIMQFGEGARKSLPGFRRHVPGTRGRGSRSGTPPGPRGTGSIAGAKEAFRPTDPTVALLHTVARPLAPAERRIAAICAPTLAG